jgi:hypothetical protein
LNVRGALFADYVRMIRRRKDVDWGRHLSPEDLAHVLARVDPAGWYPMAVFERLGNAILAEIAGGDLGAVRMWGRLSAEPLAEANPGLVVSGDPMDSLMRFKVLRGTFFDFPALEIPVLSGGEAHLVIRYHMGRTAEEAACVQTMGFCEGLLALAGATEVEAGLQERSWANDAQTRVVLRWT